MFSIPTRKHVNYILLQLGLIIRRHVNRIKPFTQIYPKTLLLGIIFVIAIISLLTGSRHKSDNSKNLKDINVRLKISKICNIEVPKLAGIRRNTFQRVKGADVFVYSAYLDRRLDGEHKIRIIAIAADNTPQLQCITSYSKGIVLNLPAEKVAVIQDPHLQRNFKYKPYFYYCSEILGRAVSVSSNHTILMIPIVFAITFKSNKQR